MVRCAALLVCFGLLETPAVPQSSSQPPQQNVTVQVRNAQSTPPAPVEGVRVSLTYLADSRQVTDALKITNSAGEAYLQVSRDLAQQGVLRIEIGSVTDLAIYQPADGQVTGFSDKPILLLLLSKGSPALLGPAQIEATLRRLSTRASSLERRNRSLQGQVAVARGELAAAQAQKEDLAAAMSDWATANGFPQDEAGRKVQQWAEDIQRRSQQASDEQRALAEFALRNYGVAAKLFEEAANREDQTFAVRKKLLQEELRKEQLESLNKSVDDTLRSVKAYQLNAQPHQATTVIAKAVDRLAKEHNENKEDDEIAKLWLRASVNLADARLREGEVSPANASNPLLAQTVKDYEALAKEYADRNDHDEWANTQRVLGGTLMRQGERATGEISTELFAKAVQALEHALKVYSKADFPQDWAATQNDMGAILLTQGERVNAQASSVRLTEAVQAFERALEVYTKADLPQDWARIQENLGKTLMRQGERATGDESTALFDKSVEAYEHALEVYTKTDSAQNWARTEKGLGSTLLRQGERTSTEASTALFAKAAHADEHALEVYTKADLPQEWAGTQLDLGVILMDQAVRTTGQPSVVLLGEAVQAYEHALEVYTKADLPQSWAMTQDDLGLALLDQAVGSTGEQQTALFDKALQAYEHALEVYTKADLPQDWARTQNNLGLAPDGLRSMQDGRGSSYSIWQISGGI